MLIYFYHRLLVWLSNNSIVLQNDSFIQNADTIIFTSKYFTDEYLAILDCRKYIFKGTYLSAGFSNQCFVTML